jgi:hypothetical protein
VSGCRIIQAHNHDSIAERVQKAISAAADDIAELYEAALRDGNFGVDAFRRRAHEMIMARAYYGDALVNGEITEQQLKEIHEFARKREPISEEVYDEFLSV